MVSSGIEGAWRFINKLWRLVMADREKLISVKSLALSSLEDAKLLHIRKATHKTIAAVTEDIERFHFNKAIARIRELSNVLGDIKSDNTESLVVYKEAVDAIIHLLQPFMPHLAEELWQQLENDDVLVSRPWPVADKALLVDEEVTIAVQINGKLRATIQLPRDMDKVLAEEKVLGLQAIKDALKDKQVNKVIVVPNRIVNVVAK